MIRTLTSLAVLAALSACQVGVGIGDSGGRPAYSATDTLGSAVAQASMGTVPEGGN
jgi:hypothetical protein